MRINGQKLQEFNKTVRDFYGKNKRILPWRETDDPYRIFVSEVMLQQTQVKRVLAKYPEFIALFPDFTALAKAPGARVLAAWQGMGYNRRALYLRRAAGIIAGDYGGKLPQSITTLDALPGIGKATAASILVYSFNMPFVFIETNVRRVFIHHFFRDREDIDDREIEPLVGAAMDRENPREWYWALMDYGTWLAGQVENPNRRSKSYVVQSKFEGSDRQIRGKILRRLLAGALSEEAIISETGADPERARLILKGLSKDGLIRERNNRYFVA